MVTRWLHVDPGQDVLVRDHDCQLGKPHRVPLLNKYPNEPVYCLSCMRRMWIDYQKDCWYAIRRAYRIEEEPW